MWKKDEIIFEICIQRVYIADYEESKGFLWYATKKIKFMRKYIVSKNSWTIEGRRSMEWGWFPSIDIWDHG